LDEGDAINIDVTAILDGHYGDTSRMYAVGEISIKSKNLIDATYNSMMKAINILKPGLSLGDIGNEIQSYVEEKGFSVVRDFCGHGISTTFHEPPNILHYGKKNTGIKVYPGMTFTIEPMINFGKYDVKLLNDGWTAVTKDKSLSAQFEHTVGITENGYEIFTESAKGYSKPPYK
jgi:methionyl aminopeptidase